MYQGVWRGNEQKHKTKIKVLENLCKQKKKKKEKQKKQKDLTEN